VGTSSCPTGFACDPMLGPSFGAQPVGLGGHCLKTCMSDDDCSAGSTCALHGGMTTKTCGVDRRFP
jgi:hypothetical protein